MSLHLLLVVPSSLSTDEEPAAAALAAAAAGVQLFCCSHCEAACWLGLIALLRVSVLTELTSAGYLHRSEVSHSCVYRRKASSDEQQRE